MPKKPANKNSFEDSIEKLESIVNLMEEENLPLETLLTNYEQGQELLAHCQGLIDNARERIEIVQFKSQSSSEESENKLASDPAKGDNPASEDSSDDTRLL